MSWVDQLSDDEVKTLYKFKTSGVDSLSDTEVVTLYKYKDMLGSDQKAKSKRDVGFAEEAIRGVSSGVLNAGNRAVTGAYTGLAGLSRMFGADNLSTDIMEKVAEQDKQIKSLDPMEGINAGATGRLSQIVGQIPSFAALPLSLLQGFGMAGETGRKHLDDGGSLAGAQIASGLDAALFSVGMKLPSVLLPGAKPVTNALLGAGANTAQEEASYGAQQIIRDIDKIKALPDRDVIDRIGAAAPGAVMGYVGAKPTTTNTQPTTKTPESKGKFSTTEEEFKAGAKQNLETRLKLEENSVVSIQKKIDSLLQSAGNGFTEKQLNYYKSLEAEMEKTLTEVSQIRENLKVFDDTGTTPSQQPSQQPPSQPSPTGTTPSPTTNAVSNTPTNTVPNTPTNIVSNTSVGQVDNSNTPKPEPTLPTDTTPTETSKPQEGELLSERPMTEEENIFSNQLDDMAKGVEEISRQLHTSNNPKQVVEEKGVTNTTEDLQVAGNPKLSQLDDPEITHIENKIQSSKDSIESLKAKVDQLKVERVKAKMERSNNGDSDFNPFGVESRVRELQSLIRDHESRIQMFEQELARKRNSVSNPARSYLGDPETRVDTNLVAAIDSGGVYGGLRHVIESEPDGSPLSIVAEHLINNKSVDPDIVLKDGERSPDMELGNFDPTLQNKPGQGTISLWEKGKNSITLVHEAVHAASASVFAKYRSNFDRMSLTSAQRGAVKALEKLLEHVQKQNLPSKFTYHLENLDEFTAYGLTDHVFQAELAKIKYEGGNVLTKFARRLAQAIGISDPKGTTALEELLNNGLTVIDTSGKSGFNIGNLGKVLSQKLYQAGQEQIAKVLQDPAKFMQQDEVLKILVDNKIPDTNPSLYTKLLQNITGDDQFLERTRVIAPYAFNVGKLIRKHTQNATMIENSLLNDVYGGDPNLKRAGFFNLGHQSSPTSVKDLWTKKVKHEDVSAVFQVMRKGFEQPVNPVALDGPDKHQLAKEQYERNLNAYGQHLTDHQKAIYNAATKMFLGGAIEAKIGKLRAGWFPSVRRGDHVVTLSYKGQIVELETFRDKAQADIFTENVRKQYPNFETNYADKSDDMSLREAYNTFRDVLLETSKGSKDPNMQKSVMDARKVIDEIVERMAQRAKFGKHEVHRTGIPGYQGTKIMQNDVQNMRDFQSAVIGMPHEFGVLHKNRALMQEFQKGFLSTTLHTQYPVQAELSLRMLENALNNRKLSATDKIGKLIHEVANSTQTKVIDKFINPLIGGIVTRINKQFGTKMSADGLQMPTLDALDRTLGLGAAPFYWNALTRRPAVWIGQVLTTPFSIRQMIVDAAYNNEFNTIGTFVDTFEAVAKGMVSSAGKQDPWFQNIMSKIVQDTYSVQPSFTNDLTSPISQTFGSSHETAKNTFEYATGAKALALSDSVSRYMVAASAIHLYKKMGMTDEQIVFAASKLTDTTMVQYGKQHTPPIINKMGTVGQMFAPLMKYPIAQMANMINDIHFAKDNFTKAPLVAVAPALLTVMTSAVMGGVGGTALVVEYELLRWLFKQMYTGAFFVGEHLGADMADAVENLVGESEFDELVPPASVLLMRGTHTIQKALEATYSSLTPNSLKKEYPQLVDNAARFGVPTAITGPMLTELGQVLGVDLGGEGIDVASGIRFQSMLGSLFEKDDHNITDAMAVVNWWTKLITEKVGQSFGTDAEQYKVLGDVLPVVGGKMIADEMLGRDYDYTVKGGKEERISAKTNQSQIAKFLGSKTIETPIVPKFKGGQVFPDLP